MQLATLAIVRRMEGSKDKQQNIESHFLAMWKLLRTPKATSRHRCFGKINRGLYEYIIVEHSLFTSTRLKVFFSAIHYTRILLIIFLNQQQWPLTATTTCGLCIFTDFYSFINIFIGATTVCRQPLRLTIVYTQSHGDFSSNSNDDMLSWCL